MAKSGALRAKLGVAACIPILSVAVLFATPGQAQGEESTGAQLGKLTAFATRCGYHEDAGWLQANFGRLAGFAQANRKTSLYFEGYDIVYLRCGRVRKAVGEIKAAVAAEEG